MDPLAALAQLDGVASAVQSARDAVDAVLADRGLRRVDANTRAAARIRAARASAELEARAGMIGVEALTEAGLRVYAEAPELAAEIRRTPPQVLSRIHLLLARGQAEPEALGRHRADEQVVARMQGVAELLTARTSAPALVLAAVVHAEIASVAPFGFADGMIGRSVEHLVLIDAGLDPLAVIVPEAGHNEAAADYAAALTGYRTGSAMGVRDWIVHCARAVMRGAERSPVMLGH